MMSIFLTVFNYTRASGITLGHEESNGGSIDTTIKNGIELDLFKTFKYKLEVSVSTGNMAIFKIHVHANKKTIKEGPQGTLVRSDI